MESVSSLCIVHWTTPMSKWTLKHRWPIHKSDFRIQKIDFLHRRVLNDLRVPPPPSLSSFLSDISIVSIAKCRIRLLIWLTADSRNHVEPEPNPSQIYQPMFRRLESTEINFSIFVIGP